ncbi:uncharacterized protein LOC112508589 [Cynara cardunculus var. scolymus]|uniref:C2 domain-containing protein n=1 Tax=Cynara cardunculus var. scolymus TaxID=59895 RepID=A0A118K4D6_CYNCS|nr:uncharacterized protein LOC112508589 [Cynara cardunculus var. scolymus]KVI07335.1 hypothetical protein Ccrd_014256 [Cynara cardunculus var. scolymus]
MSSRPRSKRLEITLISGHDLPPIARNLTTYAVAWLKPDHKLTTQVDHGGHTNPKWDHKFVFNLDRSFSISDTTTTVTFEIYNVGWLRDFLVGSAQVIVSNLVERRSKNHRPVTVQLRRPTGILQGVLNVGVNLIDRSNDNVGRNVVSRDPIGKIGVLENDEDRKMNDEKKLERSRSERTAKFGDFSVADEGGDGDGDRRVLSRSMSGCSVTQIGSVNSMMRPLPSEVVAALKNGMYSTGGDDIESYVFSAGTVEREPRNDKKDLNAMVAKWRHTVMNDKTPVVDNRRLISYDHEQRRKKGGRGRGGLFSCFGNIKGKEFSFICGNNEPAKRKKRKPKA